MVEYSIKKNLFLTVKNLFYSALMQSELGQRAALNGQLAYRQKNPPYLTHFVPSHPIQLDSRKWDSWTSRRPGITVSIMRPSNTRKPTPSSSSNNRAPRLVIKTQL